VDIVQPNFGVRIRKLRLDRGLSQSQLADLIGLSEDQISNIERGKSWVGEQTLALLAAALQVKQSSLFDYTANDKFLRSGGLKARASRRPPSLVVRRKKVSIVANQEMKP